MPRVVIKYKVDRRIKVAEVSTGTKKFLVGLQDFIDETGINDFSEANTGEAIVTGESYRILWGDRIQ